MKQFKKYSLNNTHIDTQTDTSENITYPHLQVAKNNSKLHILCCRNKWKITELDSPIKLSHISNELVWNK